VLCTHEVPGMSYLVSVDQRVDFLRDKGLVVM